MTMTYKDYTGTVAYDPRDRIFHGRVNGITDLISFQGTTVEELEADFRAGIDSYLQGCSARGFEPQRPYSGRFVLRLEPSIHGRVTAAARQQKTSINKWIARAIQVRLESEAPAGGTHADEPVSDAAGG